MFHFLSVRWQRLPGSIMEEAVPSSGHSRHQYDARISRNAPRWFPSHCDVWSLPKTAPRGWEPTSRTALIHQLGNSFPLDSKSSVQVQQNRTSICYAGRSQYHTWEQEFLLLLSVRNILTVSLVLSDGCSAVLYEALDDSPDDMYLDWFQGQLCLSEEDGLVGPVWIIILNILPSRDLCQPPSRCLLFFVVPHPLFSFCNSLIFVIPNSKGVVLQWCKIVFLSPWLKRTEGGVSSYGLRAMLADE